MKGPYLSPGDGDVGNLEQVGCIRPRECVVVREREGELTECVCVYLSVCLPHSLDAELRQKKQECAGRWPEIKIRREKKTSESKLAKRSSGAAPEVLTPPPKHGSLTDAFRHDCSHAVGAHSH